MPPAENKANCSTKVLSPIKELLCGVNIFVGLEALIRIYSEYPVDTGQLGLSREASIIAAPVAIFAAGSSTVLHFFLNRAYQDRLAVTDEVTPLLGTVGMPSEEGMQHNPSILRRSPIRYTLLLLLGLGDLLGHAGEAMGFFIFITNKVLTNVSNRSQLLGATVLFHAVSLFLAVPDVRTCLRVIHAPREQKADWLTKIATPLKELFASMGTLTAYAVFLQTFHCRFGDKTALDVSSGALIIASLFAIPSFFGSLVSHYYLNVHSGSRCHGHSHGHSHGGGSCHSHGHSHGSEQVQISEAAELMQSKSFFSKYLVRYKGIIGAADLCGHAAETMGAVAYLFYLGLQDILPEGAFITLMVAMFISSFVLAGPDNTTCRNNLRDVEAKEIAVEDHSLNAIITPV